MPNSKSFWKRPEGITGAVVLGGLALGAFWVGSAVIGTLTSLMSTTPGLLGTLGVLAGVAYVALDPKMRNLIWYAYKSVMRWITGVFVEIDPIAILKSYIENLEDNLRKMSKQIGALRGQIRQLQGTYDGNVNEINNNMRLAEKAKASNDEANVALNTRKAGRLQEANAKYKSLLDKMDILYRMLTRMYENSEIMLEDTRDQVHIKEQEYLAITAGNSAIKSAMSVLKGDPDQRALFDQATEALADEVSAKVGEMERFMDTSRNLMDSIDLQNGVFEDEGLRLLEEWEQKGVLSAPSPQRKDQLDLNQPRPEPLKETRENSAYDNLFD